MSEGWNDVSFESAIIKVPKPVKIPRKKFLESGRFPIISQERDFINGRWDTPEDVFTITALYQVLRPP